MSDDPTPSVDHNPAGEPGAKFRDWPTNLPREDLVRMLRGYAQMSMRIEQRIAAVFPDRFPLGDGDVLLEDQRLVVDEDAEAMAELACEEIARLAAELAEARAEAERLRADRARLSAGLAAERARNAHSGTTLREFVEDAAPVSVPDRPAETVPELLEQMRGTPPPPEVAAARETHERRQREPLPNHRIGATAPSEIDTPEET